MHRRKNKEKFSPDIGAKSQIVVVITNKMSVIGQTLQLQEQ